ncbi:MAG: YqiJ family protein [Thermoflexibacter sp.]|jgi:hypothetical protein|nr:YqiJ family protein [Thermoflexibacter sp.]
MQFIIDLLEKSHNWLYSFFIFISIGIWLISALGVFHHADSVEGSHEIGSIDSGGDFLHSLGEVLGFGMVPSSVLITLILFFQGVTGIALNEWLLATFHVEGWLRYLLLVVNFLLSLGVGMTVASFISRPLRYLFKDYGAATKAEAIVGKIAQVSSGKVNADFGQAVVKLEDGNTIEVAVRIAEQQNSLEYGQKLLILDFDKEKNVYLVDKYE